MIHCTDLTVALKAAFQALINRPDREYFPTEGWQVLAEECVHRAQSALEAHKDCKEASE